MVETELETRVKTLETEIELLKSKFAKIEKKGEENIPWWKQHLGIFANDPIYDEAMRLGREYRESQRMNYDEDDE